MAWTATHRYARITERKVRLVADLIRGRGYNDAVELLRHTPKRAAKFVSRVLKSAAANANEAEADMKQLYVSEARVDSGPIIKRFKAKDRGRAHPIHRRTSHIVISVEQRR